MNEPSETGMAPGAPIIRGLRTMAIVRWILILAVAGVAASTWWIYVISSESTVEGPDRYYCPMHPQIRSPEPGTCPICFMRLEPIPEDRNVDAHLHDAGVLPSPGDPPSGLSDVALSVERRQSGGIVTTAASRRTVARTLRLPALIESPEGAVSEVRVRASGFVERVADVETGQTVHAGQPLLWFYSPELLRAQEELITAERLRSAEATDGTSAGDHGLGDRVIAAARQQLLLLGAQPGIVERVLQTGRVERLVPVSAAASGTITARDVSVGAYATPDMVLFQITDLSRTWMVATVSMDDVDSIPVGIRGHFLSRTGGRSYGVEATLREPRADTMTRTARVRFTPENPDSSLVPGDLGEIVVSLPESEYLLVPRDAVVNTGGVQYVFVEQAAGLFSPRIVEVGPLIGEERAILGGIDAGDHVVSRGAFVMDSESRLRAAVAPSSSNDARSNERGESP